MARSNALLDTRDVHLWHVSLDAPEIPVDLLTSFLSKDEIDRMQRFKFPIHQRRFGVARGVLRVLLAEYLNCAPQALEFVYNAHGKPSLARAEIFFNLSHSVALALFAFTKLGAIGVDLEHITPLRQPGIAQRYFSARENALLDDVDASVRERCFYQLWARKEALIKAVGQGLQIPLTSFSVTLAPTQTLLFMEVQWHVANVAVAADYAAAVAIAQVPDRILLRPVNLANWLPGL